MTLRVAINGYGRIGRNVLRALFESPHPQVRDGIRIVAINDLGDARALAHLTRHDTAHGRFAVPVHHEEGCLVVGDQRIQVTSVRQPGDLPWKALGVDLVMECTGLFTTKARAGAHLSAGASKVLISAPGGADVDATIVYGVNHASLRAHHTVVSNASCTTNCLAPVAQVLHEAVGIDSGLMTTIHSYTNDQVLTDVYHEDLRRARSATQSMIPTKTGAAAALGLVLPALAGRLDGFAVRVPTLNVSMVDLSFIAARPTTVAEVNALMREATAGGALSGVLGYSEEPLVSIDFNHDPRSSIFDGTCTKVSGRLVKVCAWYDNEWGFSNRMLDTAGAMARA